MALGVNPSSSSFVVELEASSDDEDVDSSSEVKEGDSALEPVQEAAERKLGIDNEIENVGEATTRGAPDNGPRSTRKARHRRTPSP